MIQPNEKSTKKNIYNPTNVELIHGDPSLTLHERLLAFNLICMNITDY